MPFLGTAFDLYGSNVYEQTAMQDTGRDDGFYDMGANKHPDGLSNNRSVEEEAALFAEQRARIQELKKQYPQIQTFSEVVAGLGEEAKDARAVQQKVGSRATGFGTIGGFAGSMVGSFSPERDPLNVLSVGIAPVGKALLLRMASEFGIGAATETINQFTGVSRTADLYGIEHTTGQALTDIAAVGVGSAALRGVIDGAPRGLLRLEEKALPLRALGREMNAAVDKATALNVSPRVSADGVVRDFANLDTEVQLQAIKEMMPGSPTARAVVYDGERAAVLREGNPFSDTPGGRALYLGELGGAERSLQGELLSGTAVERTLNPYAPDFELPRNLDSSTRRVQSLPDDAQKRVDDMQVRIEELDEYIASNQRVLEKIETDAQANRAKPFSDYLSEIDADQGARLAAIDDEIAALRALPREQRAPLSTAQKRRVRELKKRRSQIVHTREAAAAVNPQRRDTQALDAQRVALENWVAKFTNERDFLKGAIATRFERQRVASFKDGPQPDFSPAARSGVVDVLGRQSRAAPFAPSRPATVDDVFSAVRELSETPVETARALDATLEATDSVQLHAAAEANAARLRGAVGDGADPIEIHGQVVDGKTRVTKGEALDEDGNPVTTSLRELMDDIADDDALVKAVKECSI